MATNKKMSESLIYKGKPLIRCDKILYYGSMTDSHIIRMQIFDTVSDHGLPVASKVMVTLMQTDEKLNPAERVVKNGEKKGLYEAIDIADVWLTRALSNKN